MKPHPRIHSIHFLSLYFIILFLPIPVLSQNWPGQWRGDIDDYVLSDGLLTHADDGRAGQSTVYLDYTPSSTMLWGIEVNWTKLPSTYNTFTWTIFEEVTGDEYLYKYSIRPSNRGETLDFIRTFCRVGSGDTVIEISYETLHTIIIHSPHTDWQQLSITVSYDQSQGLILQAFSPHSGLQVSPAITLKGGTMRGTMRLHSRYTAMHKLDHHWSIPTASSTTVQSLVAQKITAQEGGLVTVSLNKSVDISSATVTLAGFAPTITYGSTTRELLIQIGRPFAPNRLYDFNITDLVDMYGQHQSLQFTIDTTVDPSPDTPKSTPEGIFITEIMADPPSEGRLSLHKYIEIYNNTSVPVSLDQIILQYRSQKLHLPSVPLAPQSYIVLYPNDVSAPTDCCATVDIDKFPALSGDFTLSLIDAKALFVMDRVYFSSALYGYGEKRGGASVERIGYNPDRWRRSNHPTGGTPGMGSNMTPYSPVSKGAVVLNELMLSPAPTGEKYIELYNNSDTTIDLTHLYLSYRNGPDQSRSTWSTVDSSYLLAPQAYCVLCPYPDALPKVHAHVAPATFVERIHFPSISPTYSEIELRSRADDSTIDAIIYRRQWLGDRSTDRTKYSLERTAPDADGTKRESWRRSTDASKGGTPGLQNSVFGLSSTIPPYSSDLEWPDTPELSYDDMLRFMRMYPQYAHMEVYTLNGQPLASAEGTSARDMLRHIQHGTTTLPSMLLIIRIRFVHPDPDQIELVYSGKWAHTPTS